MPPAALILILILGIGILFLHKTAAAMLMFIGALYIPLSSRVILGPADFTAVRILVLFSFTRVIARQEYKICLNRIDKTIILWMFSNILTGLLLDRQDTTIFLRLGQAYDVIGSYFSFRFWLRTKEDITKTFAMLGFAILPMAMEMVYEQVKIHNLFSYLGGISERPGIRDGRIRSQAAFAHSILAGTIGATSLGFCIPLYRMNNKKMKISALAGMFACIVITFTSSSSGPIMSLFFIITGYFFWFRRYQMKSILRIGILSLIMLEIVMESHVWYLIGKIDLTGSSTGWHRAELINNAIEHLGEWWLLGTDFTRHWMPTGVSWNPRHTDITNHYLINGVNGGLVTMLLFIRLISCGFSYVGKMVNTMRTHDKEIGFLAWSLGVILFSHTVTFVSVAYFDQTIYAFYFLLAAISSLYSYVSSNIYIQDTYIKV